MWHNQDKSSTVLKLPPLRETIITVKRKDEVMKI